MKHYATGKWEVIESAPHVCVTIEDSAQRYLSETVKADDEVLLLVRDRYSPDAKPRWQVSHRQRAQLPARTVGSCCITRLGNLTVLIAQKPHVHDLSGRVMRVQRGTLVLD